MELKYSLSYSVVPRRYFNYPWIVFMPAPLCCTGWMEALEGSRPTSGTEFLTSLTKFLQIDGAMYLVWKILLIVPPEVYFLFNWKSTISGGMDPSGYNSVHLTGQSSLTYLSRWLLKKKENRVTWSLLNPSNQSLLWIVTLVLLASRSYCLDFPFRLQCSCLYR